MESPKIKIQAVRAPAVSPVVPARALAALPAPLGAQSQWAALVPLEALAALPSQTAPQAAQVERPALALVALLAADRCHRAARPKPPLRNALWVASAPVLRASKKMAV